MVTTWYRPVRDPPLGSGTSRTHREPHVVLCASTRFNDMELLLKASSYPPTVEHTRANALLLPYLHGPAISGSSPGQLLFRQHQPFSTASNTPTFMTIRHTLHSTERSRDKTRLLVFRRMTLSQDQMMTLRQRSPATQRSPTAHHSYSTSMTPHTLSQRHLLRQKQTMTISAALTCS